MPFELFSPRMQELIQKKGFPKPTEPQRLGIPEILQGNNVLVVASTGIGKTETAMLPLLDLIYTKKMPPIALMYITPLKSLNRDLLDRLFWWADKLDIDIAVRHGDTSQQERTSQREAPPHVLISTPETLGAILTGSKMRAHLKQVKYVVIDEIHELIESKRGTQLSLLLERLRMVCGSFQIVGLSATVGTIDLAAHFLGNDVHVIETESQKQYDVKVEFPKPALQDVATSEELSVGSTTMARLRRLYELITSHDSVIAFTNTRETAEVLSSRLRTWNKELKQDVHHGSLSKEHRIKSEQKFKDKELRSLIATSSLELGIDIGAVDLVVQYLSPRRVTKCIQRVGRAGHTFWKTSKGVILSGDEDLFESAVIAKRTHEKALEKTKVHDHALDVLAHQILGLLLDQFEWTPAALYAIVSKSYLYRNLSRKEFDGILDFLAQLRLISITEKQDGSKVVN
ncbi:MAG: DEAD/DEAH box helicase, partial [Candidatus Aenigmarchaeota archaeon]|nr:DEAD/DEAH box helicase [Candidatus Aenigmarchaeota archaeon]